MAARSRGFISLAAVVAMFATSAAPAGAAEGDLDPSFSGDGIAQHEFDTDTGGESISNVAIDPQGRIVVSGIATGSGYGIIRYGIDGTPDPTFGEGGVSYFLPSALSFASYADSAPAANGRLIITGWSDGPTTEDGDIGVAALDSAGNPDLAFGNDPPRPTGDAFVLTDLPAASSFDVPLAVAIDAQNRIVVAGRSTASETHTFLYRYLPDGSLDPSFANGLNPLSTGEDGISDLLVQPDGTLLALARVDGGWALARFTDRGARDLTYGADGLAAIPGLSSPGIDDAKLVAQPDGKLLAAITVGEPPDFQARLARLLPEGTLDPSFAGDGIVELPTPDEGAESNDVAVADDGRIVVAGATRGPGDPQALGWRFLDNGQPDTSFGQSGVTSLPPGSGFATVAIQPDRRIVLAGGIEGDPGGSVNQEFLTARFIGDQTPPNTKITKAPKKVRAGKKAKVAFREQGDVNTTFECAVKKPKRKGARGGSKLRFKECKSPAETKRLKRAGKTTFLVRAVDPAGNVDPKPAKAKIKVKPKR